MKVSNGTFDPFTGYVNLSELGLSKFWNRINKSSETDCWLWTGYKMHGYGSMMVDHHNIRIHRLSWMIHFGEIPPETPCVCHNCPSGDNPLCANPNHLWLGTHTDNSDDKVNKGRQAKGSTSGASTCPDKVRRGEAIEWSKISDPDVREIRIRKTSGESLADIAKHFGVSKSVIWAIIHRKTWKHVH